MGGKTSSKAKNDWKRKAYREFSVAICKEDGDLFREMCDKNGDTKAGILRQAVYDYIGKPVPPSKAKF